MRPVPPMPPSASAMTTKNPTVIAMMKVATIGCPRFSRCFTF